MLAPGLQVQALADQAQEVLGAAAELEADEVGAEEAAQDLVAPGQLDEQLGGREGDVQEEADEEVGALLAQHLRHELQLVVLHPDRGALLGHRRRAVREALVDLHVRVPPLPAELGRHDHVVVERPQGAVGEPLVVVGDLGLRQRHRDELEAVVLERLDHLVRRPVPPDPGPVVGVHHRLQRGHQAARRRAPGRGAVRVLDAVDGEPVGHHDEARAARGLLLGLLQRRVQVLLRPSPTGLLLPCHTRHRCCPLTGRRLRRAGVVASRGRVRWRGATSVRLCP